jgi:hypothetical protein
LLRISSKLTIISGFFASSGFGDRSFRFRG